MLEQFYPKRSQGGPSMRLTILILCCLCLNSCGAFQWGYFSQKREIASLSAQHLLREDQHHFEDRIQDKLQSLHSYYVIGQKNLAQFDELLKSNELNKVYESETYLNLIAVRTQAEEIEHELIELWQESKKIKSRSPVGQNLILKIQSFAGQSEEAMMSMENLLFALDAKIPSPKARKGLNRKVDFIQEYKKLEGTTEFIIHEKNIEHLSHMLENRVPTLSKKFYPSTTKPGNITGNEFPAKVWSLTFDDGPAKGTTQTILRNLNDRKLKATFFMLTSQAKALPSLVKEIKELGMEIASHSYTHPQLTKAGPLTIEKEVTQAVKDLEQISGKKMKFYRLPYGAGVSSAIIREKIAANNLIHVFWNIDTLDWMAQPSEKIVERTITLMKKTPRDAGVLLFHDIHQRTADATPQIMDYLKKDGRRVCTLDEIVTQINEDAETVCPK
jgi:peptidoglycan/xylan/chitin deacetylase (PgdA/CDA1 family)